MCSAASGCGAWSASGRRRIATPPASAGCADGGQEACGQSRFLARELCRWPCRPTLPSIADTGSPPATQADIQMLMQEIGKLYDATERWKDEILEATEGWKEEILEANRRWKEEIIHE